MGLGALKWYWQHQVQDFGHDQKTKYSCLIFDNRGMGESDKPLAKYSTSEMAKDVIELLDQLGWNAERELHVVGISMGGMIAQELVDRGFSRWPCILALMHLGLFGTEETGFPFISVHSG